MLNEYEFEIELLDHNYPAVARYEIDSDGTPLIHHVEMGRLVPYYDITLERMGRNRRETVDLMPLLDSNQISLIAEEILGSLRESEADNRIARYELDRAEKLAA